MKRPFLVYIFTLMLLFFLTNPATVLAAQEPIQPVSPEEITAKVDDMLHMAHEAGKPLVQTISKGILMAAAGMILLVIFFGRSIINKAVGIIICVGVGLFLYINADTVVGLFMYVSNYFSN